MSMAKLKILLATSIIGSAIFAAPAYGQVTTEDRDANVLLERIHDLQEAEFGATSTFRTDNTAPHYGAQIAHYEEEIKRLNVMIQSLSYYNSEGAYEAPESRPHLNIVAAGDTLDTRFNGILAGTENNEGLLVDFPSSSEPPNNGIGALVGAVRRRFTGTDPTSIYLKDNGFAPPGNLHEEGSSNAIKLQKLYSALYVSDNMVGSLLETRDARLGNYALLRDEANDTESVQQAIEVNNAILLENGRNLALIIDLEMAKLSAEATNLRASAQTKNITQDAFGSTALGTVALERISGLVNNVTTVDDGG